MNQPHPDFTPDFKRHWQPLLLCVLLAYGIGAGMRMIDLPKWDNPDLQVQGEYIQATHDAYHWLAGAEGIGSAQEHPLALLPRWGKQYLGIEPGNLGFFAPMIMASLVGAVCVLQAWTLGGLEAGLVAAGMASAAPGFYYRTRLGYYDTDMVTLLFPLLLCWGAAHLCRPFLQPTWTAGFQGLRRQSTPTEELPAHPGPAFLPAMLLLGVFARFCNAWHGQIGQFAGLLACMAGVLFLLMAKPGLRGQLFFGLAVFGLGAFLGRLGLVGAFVLSLSAGIAPTWFRRLNRTPWLGLLLALAVLSQAGVAQSLIKKGQWLHNTYGKPVIEEVNNKTTPTDVNATDALPDQESVVGVIPENQRVVYPAVMQSIIEAQNVDTLKLLLRLYPWPWLAASGLLGFVLVIALRPLAVFLAPLLFLTLTATTLGGRMAMFGSPLTGLGLGLPLVWLAQRAFAQENPWRRPVLVSAAFVICLAATMPALPLYARLETTPVLKKEHCEALLALRDIAPADAMVWTWWDYGYATQYYARRQSFSDGGRHTGERLYTLALAFTTPSQLQSSQLIKYAARENYTPWRVWDKYTAEEVQDFLRGLSVLDYKLEPAAKQYIVVTLENFALLHWIGFYGSWDVTSRLGIHANVVRIRETFDVNYDEGRINFPLSNTSMHVRSVDAIHKGRLHHYEYPENKGLHLVFSADTRDYFLMDDLAYDSQALRLLLADPENPLVTNHFRLVHEGFPVVRIYEVR